MADATNGVHTLRLARWREATDIPLLVLAIGSVPLLLLELRRAQLPRADQVFLDVTNAVVLAASAVDYVVELVLTDRRRSYVRREWTSLLIVIAQAVVLVPAAPVVRSLGLARLGEPEPRCAAVPQASRSVSTR